MRRVVALAAMIAAVAAGPAGANPLRQPAWAKPLIAQMSRWLRPHLSVVVPAAPSLSVPTVRGFTCYIDTIGAAIAGGAGSPCDRPAIALPILGP